MTGARPWINVAAETSKPGYISPISHQPHFFRVPRANSADGGGNAFLRITEVEEEEEEEFYLP